MSNSLLEIIIVKANIVLHGPIIFQIFPENFLFTYTGNVINYVETDQ